MNRRPFSVLSGSECKVLVEQLESERHPDRAVYTSPPPTILGEANCIRRLGIIALARSDHVEARRCFDEARPLYQSIGADLGEANCIQGFGNILLAKLQYGEARQRYEEALPLYQKVGDLEGEGECLRGLGDIAWKEGRLAEAQSTFEQVLKLFERFGNIDAAATVHRRLAHLSTGIERRRHLDAALDIWACIDRPDLVADLGREFGPQDEGDDFSPGNT